MPEHRAGKAGGRAAPQAPPPLHHAMLLGHTSTGGSPGPPLGRHLPGSVMTSAVPQQCPAVVVTAEGAQSTTQEAQAPEGGCRLDQERVLRHRGTWDSCLVGQPGWAGQAGPSPWAPVTLPPLPHCAAGLQQPSPSFTPQIWALRSTHTRPRLFRAAAEKQEPPTCSELREDGDRFSNERRMEDKEQEHPPY